MVKDSASNPRRTSDSVCRELLTTAAQAIHSHGIVSCVAYSPLLRRIQEFRTSPHRGAPAWILVTACATRLLFMRMVFQNMTQSAPSLALTLQHGWEESTYLAFPNCPRWTFGQKASTPTRRLAGLLDRDSFTTTAPGYLASKMMAI